VSLAFYFFLTIITLLFFAFLWALRNSKRGMVHGSPAGAPQDFQGSHVTHLPQIRQALAKADYEFVSKNAPARVRRQLARERRRVALSYLSALLGEFDKLLRTARVIASLSPEVVAVQEFERLRLAVSFFGKYQVVRMSLWVGLAPLPQMNDLSNLLSGYSVRLEQAMRELGERAALVAETVSPPDRRRVNPI
jgi:hypothetical protein